MKVQVASSNISNPREKPMHVVERQKAANDKFDPDSEELTMLREIVGTQRSDPNKIPPLMTNTTPPSKAEKKD